MVVQSVVDALCEETGLDEQRVVDELEVPPEVEFGDYAFPCFSLARRDGEDPASLAESLGRRLDHDAFETIDVKGPYVNVTLRPETKLHAAKEPIPVKGKDTIVVESPSPNTNKPLHFGHALNMALGQSVANILEAVGHDVITENLYNDRGIHISKSMLAYEREGNEETPRDVGKKPDHFVGDYYVLYNELLEDNPSLADEAQRMLQAWEDGDEEVRLLWETMRDWCLDGIKETLDSYGVVIDKDRFESEIYEDGRSIVEDGLERGVFEYDADGAVIADLEAEGLGEKHVLRSDGTTVYLTQDLGLAQHRVEDYDPDRVVHVVGKEQEYHFKCLFTLLDKLGFSFADKLHHLSYGHVRLPEGAMSSREGTAVHADDVKEDMVRRAKKEIMDRHDSLDADVLDRRGEVIGLAALKYYLLRTDPMHDITFDPDESLSFTGETGPYIQYTYARIQSMVEEGQKASNPSFKGLDSVEERAVLRSLIQYQDRVVQAADMYDPSRMANYALELAQAYNEFYHEHTVLVDDPGLRSARLELSERVASTLEDCLSLLGIDVVEAM